MIKRSLDITVAMIALVVLLPIMIIISGFIYFRMGGPVVFSQSRAGLNGRAFTMLKFRTMIDADDHFGNPLSDEQRITNLGRVLRSTSLDELPSLWNVLKGEMSIVGPRPLLMEYLPLYSPEQIRRHEVCPGVTGWAQVNGRNAISWDAKFAFDVWYVDNRSLWLDLKIIWITIRKVLKREGISAAGEATVSKFTGNKS